MNNKFKKLMIYCITILLHSYIFMQPVNAELKTIKVGFPEIKGFSETIDGEHRGYVYEYLMEISKYTGWKYEFLNVSLEEVTSMLKNGEIDIVGGMLKNDKTEKLFNFPEYDSGSSYTTILTLKENTEISQTNYDTLSGISIGVLENSASIDRFKEFSKKNGIKDTKIIEYKGNSDEVLHKALKNKEIDAILERDLLISEGERVAVRFSPIPYYFGTTKNNSEIVQGLNYAISQIRQIDPNYSINLYNKYFKKNSNYSLQLTEDEIEYLKNKKRISAVYVDGFDPIQDDTSNPKGIAIDILKYISNKLDIEIDFKRVSNYEDALELIKNKKADIISIPSNYNFIKDYELYMTTSYISIPILKVKNKLNLDKDKKILALPQKYITINGEDDENIIYYNNIKECIEAVNNGKADYTYSDIYSLQIHTNNRYYKNISPIYEGGMSIDMCIGISENNDIKLLRTINKALKSIQPEEINSIVYENTIENKGNVPLESFIYSNFKEVLVLLIFISSVIIFLVFIIMRDKIISKNKINELLKEKGEKDALTGILNCGASEDAIINCLLNKKEELYSAFFIIDVDNFKGVNDNFGHKIGDDVLKKLSNNLSMLFKENSIVGRRGGDEFIVFMNDISTENLSVISNKAIKLCNLMDKDIIINNITQHISVSIGIVVSKKRMRFTEMYQLADKQLYKVKENGRNGYEVNIVN